MLSHLYDLFELHGDVEVYSTDGSLLYQGTMKQGRITGSGKLYLEEKLLYEGQFNQFLLITSLKYIFLELKYNLQGFLAFQTSILGLFLEEKLLYEGQFKEEQFEGKGTLYQDEKVQYEGMFWLKLSYSVPCPEYFPDITLPS